MQQTHIHFRGMVQGVGFRYTAQSYARQLNVCGWVKNLPDGSVEVIAQGGQNDIEELCKALKSHFGGYIRDIDQTLEDAFEEFSSFQIRF